MDIPKSVQKLAEKHNLTVKRIRFTSNGQSQYGWALGTVIEPGLMVEQMTLEPNILGCKWYCHNKAQGTTHYLNRLPEVKDVYFKPVKATGYLMEF